MRRVASSPTSQWPQSNSVGRLRFLPAVCLALAALNLNVGLVLAFFTVGDLEPSFYQTRVLAVTHTLTLGWISLTIIGVLYRYVPALTKQPVRWPRLAGAQVITFVVGTLGLVSHFWIGELSGMAWSAGVLLLSIGLLLACLLPLLTRAPVRDATAIGIAVALLSFFGVAALGLLYAIDMVHPFLGGRVLTNIAAHAHLAVLGWVSLTICAVSYRMVAGLVLPESALPVLARRQIVSLAVVAPVLVVALLCRSTLMLPLACLTIASLLWYGTIILHLLRSRRLPLDWNTRHVQAALAHLVAAMACGLAFAFGVDASGIQGEHLVVAYGILGILGWVSNFLLGVGGRLIPSFTKLHHDSIQPLFSTRIQALIFWCFNLGVLVMVAAALVNVPSLMRTGIVFTLAAAVPFAGAIIRRTYTLRATERSSEPAVATTP